MSPKQLFGHSSNNSNQVYLNQLKLPPPQLPPATPSKKDGIVKVPATSHKNSAFGNASRHYGLINTYTLPLLKINDPLLADELRGALISATGTDQVEVIKGIPIPPAGAKIMLTSPLAIVADSSSDFLNRGVYEIGSFDIHETKGIISLALTSLTDGERLQINIGKLSTRRHPVSIDWRASEKVPERDFLKI